MAATDLDEVLDLLGDRTVRAILVAATGEPRSAAEIAEACDIDPSTVYRHVDDLVAAGLLAEQTEIESDGSHHSLYETALDHLYVYLAADGFDGRIQVSQTPSERFTQIWDDIRQD
ncbi:MAG: ArsR/SmtB family transcription factor [Haloarculaceae archaeon]